jgi:hypothetical protein
MPSSQEILLAPWTAVDLPSRIVLAIQVFWVVVGLHSRSRQQLQGVSWFVAIMIGPPLLWILCATSFTLVLSFQCYDFWLDNLFRWLAKLPIIIGVTVLLQAILAWQYAPVTRRSLPWFGFAFGLLAILGDIVFYLWAATPR